MRAFQKVQKHLCMLTITHIRVYMQLDCLNLTAKEKDFRGRDGSGGLNMAQHFKFNINIFIEFTMLLTYLVGHFHSLIYIGQMSINALFYEINDLNFHLFSFLF